MTVATREDSSSLPEPDTAPAAPAKPLFNRSIKHTNLPDDPLAIIEPSKSWSAFDRRELWAHRELLYFLTLRDLKVRYKQTLFGVAWVVMQPLLMTLIFTVFLGILARVPTNGLPYPLVVFSGLLPWTFFSIAVTGCGYSLVANSNLITKVYFPRVLIPAATVLARLVDFAISLAIMAVLLLFYRYVLHYQLAFTWRLAALPFLIVLLTLFTLGLGMLVSSLNVKYRDVGMALPALIQLGMFVSPVIYTSNIVPEKFRAIYFLNPLAGIIEGFRGALLGERMNRFGLGVAVIATIVLLICSALIFRQTEKSFADVV